jgi:hypothetical protein
MKLTKESLKRIVLDEMAKFGKEKNVKDVKAKEVEACDLADTLEAKKDFTVKEALKKVQELKLQEQKLSVRLAEVRAQRAKLNKQIAESQVK